MSDPNDAWNNSAPAPGGDNYERSPRRERSPPPAPRNRSRSPGATRNGGGDERPGREPEQGNRGDNLHVSGLARSVTERMLDEIFSVHGKVYKAELMTDPHTKESRGFGFVKMNSPDDAEAAIAALHGTTIEGKTISVAHARRGRARTPTPGRYHGVKVDLGGPPRYGGGGYGGGYGGDRPYQPRSYDSRYSDRGPPPPRGYDDRRYDDRRYDDRRDYYDRRDYRPRYDDRGPPPADRDPYYRSHDRGGYERRDDRAPAPRYDERPRY
ncbi:hypothetical protein DB88DRAFT_483644 [Papiliotrema laurentii]|uniref:RRM domain-containing protein n=1 Tax=Papiliotrema laurentii TaxID=5418 RepID=A0AAD9FSH0_PAPLA|nr:hypothetical protein DB88DRAFT_483644 [Papiliotrema laurentii]